MTNYGSENYPCLTVLTFVLGGKARGPRGPKSYFFMEPVANRVLGLRVALSVKLAQVLFLRIVDQL